MAPRSALHQRPGAAPRPPRQRCCRCADRPRPAVPAAAARRCAAAAGSCRWWYWRPVPAATAPPGSGPPRQPTAAQIDGIDQQRARRLQQRAAVAVQRQATADAIEQRRAEVRLQFLQGGAAGGTGKARWPGQRRWCCRGRRWRRRPAAGGGSGARDITCFMGRFHRYYSFYGSIASMQAFTPLSRTPPAMNAPALSPWFPARPAPALATAPARPAAGRPGRGGIAVPGRAALAAGTWPECADRRDRCRHRGRQPVYPRLAPASAAGVGFSKHWLLRAGIVLYGLRLTFQDIGHVGVAGVLMDVLVVASTFGLACWLGVRVFRMEREAAMLIGAGSAICGAAAVMAAEPVVRGRAAQVTVAVSTVVVFGTWQCSCIRCCTRWCNHMAGWRWTRSSTACSRRDRARGCAGGRRWTRGERARRRYRCHHQDGAGDAAGTVPDRTFLMAGTWWEGKRRTVARPGSWCRGSRSVSWRLPGSTRCICCRWVCRPGWCSWIPCCWPWQWPRWA
ncbi:hypothetical protein DdX_21685 [Ditylenchus destructor]|uniref:Uncharacterized protein n=1 Tax=Ditylenchus destructor TaxID=166010 RepID=A0AAD4QV26_9BILA|nr:hypothetical protein DdX_21685 [Ditylenchus destructor]